MKKNKNMWKDETIRKGVISSVLASLFVIIFISPILNLLWNFLAENGGVFLKNLTDSLYINAALGKRNWLDAIFYAYLFSFLIGGVIYANFYIFRKHRNLEKEIENFHEEEEKEISEEKIKKGLIKLKSNTKKMKLFIFISWILALFFISTSFFSLFRVYSDLQMNTSFEQRLNAIAPILNEQEEEELISKWALMRNRSNYEEINKAMENYANEAKITLPPLLLK